MIQHIVMLRLSEDADPTELADVMDSLASLDLPGFVGFQHGANLDFERKTQDYLYGFIATFTDAAAVADYASDPGHQALGGRLVAMCDGGGDGIMVMDLDL